MKLFEITNGYCGESYVKVYVIAQDKERALFLAGQEYKRNAHGYQSTYWTRLEATELCPDTSKEWNGESRDD